MYIYTVLGESLRAMLAASPLATRLAHQVYRYVQI